MFEEILQYAKDSCEWNHIRSIHVFVAQPKEEQVGHVVVIDIDGDISFCQAKDYQERFNLPLIEGRIRTLGFRMFLPVRTNLPGTRTFISTKA